MHKIALVKIMCCTWWLLGVANGMPLHGACCDLYWRAQTWWGLVGAGHAPRPSHLKRTVQCGAVRAHGRDGAAHVPRACQARLIGHTLMLTYSKARAWGRRKQGGGGVAQPQGLRPSQDCCANDMPRLHTHAPSLLPAAYLMSLMQVDPHGVLQCPNSGGVSGVHSRRCTEAKSLRAHPRCS